MVVVERVRVVVGVIVMVGPSVAVKEPLPVCVVLWISVWSGLCKRKLDLPLYRTLKMPR